MADLFIEIKYNIKTDIFKVNSNIKEELQKQLVSAYLRMQMGKGKDNSEAENRDEYIITIKIDLRWDVFTSKHNCGNKGLRDGILMRWVGKNKMSDYDHCKKHNLSFLVPEYLMCPKCAAKEVLCNDEDIRHDAIKTYIKDLEGQTIK